MKTKRKNRQAQALGRLAALKLSPRQRSDRARHAAQARWAKKAP